MTERYLTIRVKPRSRANRMSMDDSGVVVISVRSAPVEGAANEMVLRMLADALGLPRTALRIRSGQASRAKLVQIEGMEVAEAHAILERRARGDRSEEDNGG